MKCAPFYLVFILQQFVHRFLAFEPKSTVGGQFAFNPRQQSHLILSSVETPDPVPISSSSELDDPERNTVGALSKHMHEEHPELREYWKAYEETMSQIMLQGRVIKKSRDVESIQRFLLDPTWTMPTSEILNADSYQPEEGVFGTTDPDISAQFRSEMSQRTAAFVHQLSISKQQNAYMDRCFTYLGDRCASLRHSAPLVVGWLKWRLTGSMPRENSVSTYMYALGLLNHSDDQIVKDCLWDVVTMHDLLFPPNEKTTTLRIQSLIAQKNHLAAEKLIRSLSTSLTDGENTADVSKLRTYTPILAYYCNEGSDLEAALRLFNQMRHSQGVRMDPTTYAMLLSSLASNGYFYSEAEYSPVGEGFSSSATKLFDELATQMAEDLLELDDNAAVTLYKGLVAGLNQEVNQTSTVGNEILSIPACRTFGNGELSIGRVAINEITGVCSATGVKLRRLTLDDEQRSHVHDTLLEMAYSLQEEYRATAKIKNNKSALPPSGEYCREQLQNFSNWLAGCRDEPFTAIVDGANIAFFGSGLVQYSQLKMMVDELARLGETPLVIMPHKYTTPKFYLRHLGIVQELKSKDQQALNELKERGILYIVPATCFDDYYWMIASVTDQDLNNRNNSPSGQHSKVDRIPGQRPILVTNDQMRDHRLALLEARPFRRWTSCHIVNYSIDGYARDEWETGRNITFFPPSAFSREIQSNKCSTKTEQVVWHIPITGWDEPDRLCISIASPRS